MYHLYIYFFGKSFIYIWVVMDSYTVIFIQYDQVIACEQISIHQHHHHHHQVFFFFDKSIIIKLIRKFWSTLNTCVSSFSTCDANWFYNVIFWTHFFEFRRLMIPVGRSEMRKTRHIFHLMNDSTKFYMHIRTNFSYSFGTNPKSNPTPKFVLFLATCMVPKPKLRQKLSSKI